MKYGSRFVTLAVGMLFVVGSAVAANDDYNRVARRGTPDVDGDLTDPMWIAADWQEMDVYAGGAKPNGFAAKSAVLWDDEYLYTAIEVDDATHAVPVAVVPAAGDLWKGDSPQHRVDLDYDGAPAAADDIEWGYALQGGKVIMTAWSSPANIEFTDIQIVRDDAKKKTYYETQVVLIAHMTKQPLSEYILKNPKAKIGYSDMVNANDGADRLGWLEWSSGIGASKNAFQFGTMTFDDTPFSVDPSGKMASVWGALKAGR
ncbi:MAG: hypothetical protein O3A46_14690 [Candidatus Poribacteria bacterium]|nr:hypothetical protein [Candidatus Poribacteria bacterium]